MTLIFHALALVAASGQQQAVVPPHHAMPSRQVAEPEVDWDKEFGVERKLPDPLTGELPVEPYAQSNANAGTKPFAGSHMADQFGGQDGIRRMVNRFVELLLNDRRTAPIFAAKDQVRLKRTLFEQFCYILNAGCDYTGRNMRDAHKDLGIERADMNALVELLQQAMRENDVPFATQNRFLAKLAPMEGDVVER